MKKLFVAIVLICAVVAGLFSWADLKNGKEEPSGLAPVAEVEIAPVQTVEEITIPAETDEGAAAPAAETEAATEEPAAEAEETAEEEFPEQLATAQQLAAELQAIEDPEELMKRFVELRAEYCADPGKESYPDGYYFLEGEMVEPFENAVKELEDYEVSDPVQSEYGYHVIIRLPLDPDQIVEYTEEGTALTARAIFANDAYGTLMDSYMEQTEVVMADSIKNLDLLQYVETEEEVIPAEESSTGEEETEIHETMNYEALYASHEPDEVVMTAGGRDITWDEYYFWLQSWGETAEYYILMYSYYGMEMGWADFAEEVVASSGDQICSLAAVRAMAEDKGVELNEEEQAQIQQELEDAVSGAGEEVTDESIAAFLKEQGLTKEYYEYLTECNILYSKGMNVIFGENGANIPDEDALGYLTENGYLHAAHILISTTDLLG